ncbi:MAG: hypothetical protein ABR548_01920 [Actinomycetota bacterium]|nr:hypothetical protein [Actinomycetota bacterium]
MRRIPWKLTLPGVALLLASPAAHAAPTDPVAYTLHASYKNPAGQIITTDQQTYSGIPALVDADHSALTGVGGADILVQLSTDIGRATLSVMTLPGAPSPLPLAVVADLPDVRKPPAYRFIQRTSSPVRFAFGYDALSSTAPMSYSATAILGGADRLTTFSLDLQTAAPGSSISITGEAYTPDQNGAHLDPITARVSYAPVPTVAHLGFLSSSSASAPTLSQQRADLSSNVATTATIVMDDVQGARARHLDATVDKVPATMSLTLAGTPQTGSQSWTYSAAARVSAIEVNGRETNGAAVSQSTYLRFQDVPTSMSLTQDSPTHAALDTSSPIGLTKVGLGTGRTPAFRSDPAYLFADRNGDASSLSFQLLGLASPAEIDSGDPFLVAATMAPGPFHVLIGNGSAVTDAHINDLPATFRFAASTTQQTVSYSGAAGIGSATLDATDPAGFAGSRATALHVLLNDIPAAVDLTFSGTQQSLSFDAHGGTLGLFEAQLTSGPDERIDPAHDGILVKDLSDRFVAFGRITGVKVATIGAGTLPSISLSTTGGRPFVADIRVPSANGNGTATALATVDNVPANLDMAFSSATGFTYSASAPVSSITLDAFDPDGLSGRATNAHVLIQNLPLAFDATLGTDGSATLDAHGGTVGLFQAQLTSGADDQIEPSKDGVLLEDLADRFVVFARLTGLQKATIGQGTLPSLSLQTTGGRTFVANIQAPSPSGTGSATALATITSLPASIDLSFASATNVTYTASAAVGSITLDLSDTGGLLSSRATAAHVVIQSLPSAFDATLASDGSLSLDAHGGTLGMFQVQLTSGPDDSIDAAKDGVLVENLPDRYVIFARLSGLESATIGRGALPTLKLATNGGREFVMNISEPAASGAGLATLTADINTLAPMFNISLASVTSFSYSASAPVSSVAFDASNPDGLAGRATAAHVLLQSLPLAIDTSFATDGTVTLDAHGGTVGLVQFQLTSGPDDQIDPAYDGLLLEDLSDRYVSFARITGLRSASAKSPNFSIDSIGGRIFKFDTEQLDAVANRVAYLRGTIDRLVPGLSIQQFDIPTGTKMIWDASQPTTSLTMDTNSGDRWNLHTDISSPLPAHFEVCSASDGVCTGATAGNRRYAPNGGSQRIAASEPMTMNVFDCQRPNNATCSPSTATKYTQITNLRVRLFELDTGTSGSLNGYIYENTTDHSSPGCATSPQSSDTGACHYRASGTVKSRDTAAGSGIQQTMGSNFWADSRFGGWSLGFACCKSNYINCDNTSLTTWISNSSLSVTSYLC